MERAAQGDPRSYESGKLEAGFLLGGSAQLCRSRVGWGGGVKCCLLDQGLTLLRPAFQGESHDGVTGMSCLSTYRFITLGQVLVPLGVFRKVRMELVQ